MTSGSITGDGNLILVKLNLTGSRFGYGASCLDGFTDDFIHLYSENGIIIRLFVKY